MSVENFLAHYPPHPGELRGAVDAFGERRSFGSSSRVAILARALTDDASSGLRELMKRFAASGLTFKPDLIMALEMSPEQRGQVRTHHAAIVLGISVVALEDTLTNGAFDKKSFAQQYNMALSGTHFETADLVGPEIEALSRDHMRRMYECVGKDKTFCRFFEHEDGMAVMPPSLRDILMISGSLPTIREELLPKFQERATLLVEA